MADSLILPVAERDVVEIFEYHLDHSDGTASRFADAVIEVVRRLEQFPYSGAPRQDLGEDVRVVSLNRQRANLYYAVVEGDRTTVTVLRVLRQERRVSKEDFP